MKITIHALHLGAGGVENYLISLANMLSDYYEVTLVSTYKVSSEPFFTVSPKVRIIYLTDTKPLAMNFKDFFYPKKMLPFSLLFTKNVKLLFQKYLYNYKYIKSDESDIIISSRIFHNKIISKYCNKQQIKIATEHNYHNNDSVYVKKLLKSLSKFDYLVPISLELTRFYENLLEEKIKCVHIPFYVEEQIKKSDLENLDFIYIGRLSPEKGGESLINVFNEIYQLDNGATLTIVGDGVCRKQMEEISEKFGITNSIVFTGFLEKESIADLLLKSTFMLLTSFSESFGIVVLEAMSFGVVPIIFDTATGAVEILHGFNDLIITNRDFREMADRALELFSNKEHLISISEKLIERSKNYSETLMKKRWREFIEEVQDERNFE